MVPLKPTVLGCRNGEPVVAYFNLAVVGFECCPNFQVTRIAESHSEWISNIAILHSDACALNSIREGTPLLMRLKPRSAPGSGLILFLIERDHCLNQVVPPIQNPPNYLWCELDFCGGA